MLLACLDDDDNDDVLKRKKWTQEELLNCYLNFTVYCLLDSNEYNHECKSTKCELYKATRVNTENFTNF